MKKIFLLLLLLTASGSLFAQAIEDNSFLVEEAYNQEKGVIQGINTFQRQRSGDWAYTFTNEIPVVIQRHQFSYTIPIVRAGSGNGVGDVLLNYRYQITGLKETDMVAVAPRFSVILPTGDHKKSRGAGAVGFQFNLPVSVTHSRQIVTHWNAGTTLTPRSRNVLGERANTKGFNLGQSTVWLAKNNFNVLFETAWNYNEAVTGTKQTQKQYSLLLNPGIRWAWNFKSGMQIVPGVSLPVGVGPSYGERGFFLYLSVEK